MADKFTLNTGDKGIAWTINTNYRIEVDEGFVVEDTPRLAGNAADTNLFSFSTPANVPQIDGTLSTPADGSTLEPVNEDVARKLTIVYDRTKTRINTGNFYLYRAASPSDVLVATYDITTDVVQVNDNTYELDITDLLTPDAVFYVRADASIIEDLDGFETSAITDSTVLSFTAPSAPDLESSTPADGSTITEADDFVFTYDRQGLTVETGNVYLYESGSPDVLIATLDITTAFVFDGFDRFTNDKNDIPTRLDASTAYYITTDAGVVSDNDEFDSVAFTSTQWNFTTSSDYKRNLTTPGDAGYAEDTTSAILNTPLILNYNNTDTFTVVISPTTGLVSSMTSSGSYGLASWDSGAETYTITGTRDQINSHLTTLELTPEVDVTATITLSYSCTHDGDSYVTTQTQTVYNVLQNTEITNMIGVARSYYRDNEIAIFAQDTPQIDDGGVDPLASYTITLSSADGQFGIPIDSVAYQDTLTIVGTKSEINSKFVKIHFKADDITTNTTFTYTQSRSGTSQINTTPALNFAGAGYKVTRFETPGTHTFTPNATEIEFNTFDVLLVGGGGAGGLGGGSGGQVTEVFNMELTENDYTVTVGEGATAVDWTSADQACVFGDPDGVGPSGSGCQLFFSDPTGNLSKKFVTYYGPAPDQYAGIGDTSRSYWNQISQQPVSSTPTSGSNTNLTSQTNNDLRSMFQRGSSTVQAGGGQNGLGYINIDTSGGFYYGSNRLILKGVLDLKGGNSRALLNDLDGASFSDTEFHQGGTYARDNTSGTITREITMTSGQFNWNGYYYERQGTVNWSYTDLTGTTYTSGVLGEVMWRAQQDIVEHLYTNYIDPTTLITGGGASQAADGEHGNDPHNLTTSANYGRGASGYVPDIVVDYAEYAGGGGGVRGQGSSGGGNGYDSDGAQTAAQAGVRGAGGGAGYYDSAGNVYPAGAGGSGRVVVVSRPKAVLGYQTVSLLGSTSASTSNTIAYPAGIRRGDIALLFVRDLSYQTDTIPSGFDTRDLRREQMGDASYVTMAIGSRVLLGDETSVAISPTRNYILAVFRPKFPIQLNKNRIFDENGASYHNTQTISESLGYLEGGNRLNIAVAHYYSTGTASTTSGTDSTEIVGATDDHRVRVLTTDMDGDAATSESITYAITDPGSYPYDEQVMQVLTVYSDRPGF